MNSKSFAIALFTLIFLATNVSFAGTYSTHKDPKRKPASDLFGQSYEWHDGERVRRVWLNPEVIAQVNTDEASEVVLQNDFPSAKKLRTGANGTKFWRVRGANSTTRSKIRASSASVSEVFHDGPVESSSARVLPGGIVLSFPLAWSEKRCREWIGAKGHIIERVIESTPNTYVVKSEPGLPTLEEANRLHATGDVLIASPNWLIDVKSR